MLDQWLSRLSPLENYLIAVPTLVLGAILLVGGIILLFEPRKLTDSEKVAAIRKVLERADHIDTPRTPTT